MGKPSATKVTNSEHSLLMGRKKNSQMSAGKMALARRKSNSRTRNNIKKVFAQLRNESLNASKTSNCSTIIILDNSIQSPFDRKRKTSNSNLTNDKHKLRKVNSEGKCIVIKDDEDDFVRNTASCIELRTPKRNSNPIPIQSSTPISNNNNTLKELNISRVSATKVNNNSAVQIVNEETNDLTKDINKDSYITIDLTTESELHKSVSRTLNNTVIDLANTSDAPDFISLSNASLSMSGDSDVTVLHANKKKKSNDSQINNFANGIAKLNASDKGKLLELITQKIFSGCNVPTSVKSNLYNGGGSVTRATETVEDTYIKEVILGQSTSRNSIGSNIYNPDRNARTNSSNLRMIVIDGSNVAMEHGRGRMFSVKGLKICIDYFLKRGHVVKAFVPRFRCKFGKSSDPRMLDNLERRGLVVYTPSREIQGRLVTSYDDRYIVQCAAEFDGVIVSGDNYRDLLRENPRWQFIIENRLLQFTWVNDMIMFPKDPLGRNGPTLEQFLKYPPGNLPQTKTK